ncbi:MAG: sugar ABC transporter substrate-binding protein [Chloroflexota bacterium]|nr:sugar ABC transporter substrate-binding protein [Chloroflexota bacterium]
MLKKVVLALIVVAVLSVGFATAQDAPTVIRFGTINDPAIDVVNQLLVNAFEELHPDVDVQIEYIPGADLVSTYTTQAAAGTLPDVVFLADLYVVPFVQSGIVLDMAPLAAADESFDLTDIYDNLLGLSRISGEGLYMIPSSYDVVTMYYNIDMFEAAGAPLPQADWTWDDYIASCRIIRETSENYCLSMGGGRDSYQWWAYYVPWIEGYGGQILSDDGQTVLLSSPETIAAMEAYTALWTEHDIAQPPDFDAGGECFIVGSCASFLFIPGYMSAMRALDPQPFAWDVQVIPTLPEGKFTGMGTYGFAVSANSQNPELAWDLVKSLASPEVQLIIASNYAGTPLLRSLREDPAVVDLAGPPENITAFIENGANGILPTYFPGECGSLYAGQISQEIKEALESVILGMSSVTDAFTFANDNIQSCLDG